MGGTVGVGVVVGGVKMSRNGDLFVISELAKRTGLSPRTIRFYEQVGVVQPCKRTEVTSGNGYRLYRRAEADWLLFVKNARVLEFKLKEIRELRRVIQKLTPRQVRKKLARFVQEKSSQVDQKLKGLSLVKKQLEELSQKLDGKSQKSGLCCEPLCPTVCAPAGLEQEGSILGEKSVIPIRAL